MCQMGFLVGTHPPANPARPSARGEDGGAPSRLPAMAAEHIQAPRPRTHGHLTNHRCDSRLCSDPLLSPRHVHLYNNHHNACSFHANLIYTYIQRWLKMQICIFEYNGWFGWMYLKFESFTQVQHLFFISIEYLWAIPFDKVVRKHVVF